MRRASTTLATATLLGIVQAFASPVASADRPAPDITCASGEQATYWHGAHRFRERLLVLGCSASEAEGGCKLTGGSNAPGTTTRPPAST
jgi:hypothetical protein